MPSRPVRTVVAATAAAVVVAGAAANAGERPAPAAPVAAGVPALAVSLATDVPAGGIAPGTAVSVTGALRLRDARTGVLGRAVPGTFSLRVRDADGTLDRPAGRVTTGPDGRFSATVPASATSGVTPTASGGYRQVLAVVATDVRAVNRSAATAGAAPVTVVKPPAGLQLENAFISSVGWVKPGEVYPFRVFVRNYRNKPVHAVRVTIPAVDGMAFTAARSRTGSVQLHSDVITWRIADVPAGSATEPAVLTLVGEGRADALTADPTVVWKNLSTTAELRHGNLVDRSTSHGPKVIPPDSSFDTARYGDRPFPVVPVDYFDVKHGRGRAAGASSSARVDNVINAAVNKGSTFNLYQEMSLGQLFPHATIPSVGVATAPVKASDHLTFSTLNPATMNTCHGFTVADPSSGAPTGLYTERVHDGWYQLPGTLDYYGDDANGSAIVGAETGVGQLQAIDSGCGPTAKLAYDAAAAADPDIDYSDFDTDKDGVVDFFEVIFPGLGGNGVSQGIGCAVGDATDPDQCPAAEGTAPYDNVWPHSSSLEYTFSDPATGLSGYISHDQLKDLEGRPMWYADQSRTRMTTENMGDDLKVFVRVGPYNVNPESAIAHASVISHEYGHSLGAPDYYSTGSRSTYGDFNLMATDKSQNVSAFQLQEWGWVVPQELPRGSATLQNWRDTKVDTHTIHWQTPGGKPYTLHGPSVHNATVYTAKLPGRQVIDPKKVEQGASGSHVWWSGSGNDFGCSPGKGHNLDIYLPELTKVPAGTKVTLSMKSAWDIEWDYDYGFVLVSTPDDNGAFTSYTSVPSDNGYTTPATQNPNGAACQQKYGNGLTGTSASWQAGTATVDRAVGNYPDFTFVPDSFDISALAGKGGVVRLSYFTDPGLARPGWFVDDLQVRAGDKVIWSSDLEKTGGPTDARMYDGGCRGTTRVAPQCTDGWLYVDASKPAPFDHGYYLSLRDRSGFDKDGHGQNDRDPIGFQPGLLLEYTDEAHGYGNVGTDDPPAQSPLDAKPEPGNDTPNLDDATFNLGEKFKDTGWVDNYTDPSTKSGNWEFDYGCLALSVVGMKGDDTVSDTSDLVATVRTRTTSRCAQFDYGYGATAGGGAAKSHATAATAALPTLDADLAGARVAGGDTQRGPAALGALGLLAVLGAARLGLRRRRT